MRLFGMGLLKIFTITSDFSVKVLGGISFFLVNKQQIRQR